MKKLSPVMQALAEDAPDDWQPTPPGYLAYLRLLEHRRMVEIRPALATQGRELRWEWRRRSTTKERKAS